MKRHLKNLLEQEDHSSEKIQELFWEPSIKIVVYLFASNSELHNIEEPGWMFEYLQQLLTVNYKYFVDKILGDNLKQDVFRILTKYFFEGALSFLLLKTV